ncbi:hypothetical protein HAHI6034_11040 [Hathewaya histolytica]|uniref:Uncharacterized protein n=1 Tax=Hathewaya histolytica TaxID=1498 RepID=A0A4V6KDK1_HATHI|nr:hypothetical protein [Hathewaya histolytica]VTQ88537.1 Uncharacterised protein [Hathewaya histolytica]
MGRAERRRNKREIDRLSTSINKLDHNQIQLIDHLAGVKATNMTKESIEKLEFMVNRAVTALLIQVFPEKTFKEIKEIESIYGDLILEDAEKIRRFKDETKGDSKMAKKMMEKYEAEVRKEVIKLLDKKLTQKEAIEELAIKFPKLSKAMVTNEYKKIKVELKKEEETKPIKKDKELENAVEYIFSEEGQALYKEKPTVAKSETTGHVDQVGEVVEESVVKKDLKTDHIADTSKMVATSLEDFKEEGHKIKGLKVLEEKIIRTIKVRGENGEYEAETGKGVVLSRGDNSLYFENEEQLNEFVSEFKEVFKMVE